MSQANAIATIDAEKAVDTMAEDQRERLLIKLLALANTNPAEAGFPPMLPVELAMKIDTPRNICEAYGITKSEFAQILRHPLFLKAYQEAIEAMKVDGFSFKMKAKMQAEDYLTTAFNMVKDRNVSDSVRADLIKNTVRWAGLDAKAADVGAGGNSFSIQINLGG